MARQHAEVILLESGSMTVSIVSIGMRHSHWINRRKHRILIVAYGMGSLQHTNLASRFNNHATHALLAATYTSHPNLPLTTLPSYPPSPSSPSTAPNCLRYPPNWPKLP